jgi:hypothetical protein
MGKRNYIDLEVNSCFQVDTAILSFLALHTTHTTTEAISLILKKEQ